MALSGEELLDEFGVIFDDMMLKAFDKLQEMDKLTLEKLLKQIETVDGMSWYASARIAPLIKATVVSQLRYKSI
jgi:hypothetical protein